MIRLRPGRHRILELGPENVAAFVGKRPRSEILICVICENLRIKSFPILLCRRRVQRQVELQHVDPRVAENAEQAVLGVLRDQVAHALRRQIARGSDAIGDAARICRAIAISSRCGLSAQAAAKALAVERLMPA